MFPYSGTLLLSGGGDKAASAVFDRELSLRLRQACPRILYVPVAWSQDSASYPSCLEWFLETLKVCGIRSEGVVMTSSLNEPSAQNLDGYDAVYIGGGNTYRLLQMVRATGFDLRLKQFLESGKVLYGGSAGAIIMARSITAVLEENQIGPGAAEEGLALLGQASIRCHYAAADLPMINRFLAASPGGPLVAIPESAGLVVTSRGARAAGVGKITVFCSGRNPEEYLAGELLKL